MSVNERLRALLSPYEYTVLGELGCGGMGCVYLVRDKAGREVAAKVILPQYAASDQAQTLFLREMANCAALDHPNVVRAEPQGSSGEGFFLVMEFCAGGSIDRLVEREGPQSPESAVAIMLDVLSGLQYAHTAEIAEVELADGTLGHATGLVHRDLKPQNVLLTGTGPNRTAKVGDFGLAKAFDLAGLSGITSDSAVAGTPEFMPRQQVLDFRRAGPEVDVWAAAATLYFLLTGLPPRAPAPGTDRWLAVMRSDPVPVRARVPNLPARLAEALDSALVEEPEISVRTASEFRGMLDRAL